MKSGRLAQRLVCVLARVVKATPSTKLQKGLHRQNLRKGKEEKRKGGVVVQCTAGCTGSSRVLVGAAGFVPRGKKGRCRAPGKTRVNWK
jgi:hypothetical protein